MPAVTRVDELAKAIHKLADQLYPRRGPADQNGGTDTKPKSRLRIPAHPLHLERQDDYVWKW